MRSRYSRGQKRAPPALSPSGAESSKPPEEGPPHSPGRRPQRSAASTVFQGPPLLPKREQRSAPQSL
ncbi:hypothetical protein NDU88_002713 [Pleurodeles waltl]|uniref:Uncharacterized protein n=1 Tax=Pleurodeles waltl TaxID=8319 RepID=A0AAV7T2S6_PLEWA|nr:hypothetical protein NDU88_002713 [Pleurodeles waltl]